MQAHHDHPRVPEKKNVVAADQQRRGIKGAQVRRVVGPAQRRERPQPGAEPGVEHVGILLELPAAAVRAFLRRAGGHARVLQRCPRANRAPASCAARAVPDRNAVAPPELARDAPVANICHPVEENRALIFGHDRDQALLDGCQRRSANGLILQNHCSRRAARPRSCSGRRRPRRARDRRL